jgi:hypothetical protein
MAAEATLEAEIAQEVAARADADTSIDTELTSKVTFFGVLSNGPDYENFTGMIAGDLFIYSSDEEYGYSLIMYVDGDWYRANDGTFFDDLVN